MKRVSPSAKAATTERTGTRSGDLGRVDCHAAKRAGAHRHGVFRHGNLRAEGLKKLHDRPVPLAGVCMKPRQRDAPAQSARAEPEGAVRPVAFDFGGAGASQPLEPLDGESAPSSLRVILAPKSASTSSVMSM